MFLLMSVSHNDGIINHKACLDKTFTPDRIKIRSGVTVKTSKFNPNEKLIRSKLILLNP